MARYKTLANNTLIFAVCNFTSKLLVFFMLPFYTTVLSKEEFGTADLIVTFAGLLLPILTLGVSDGCMRFAMDKAKDTSKVFSFGISVLVAATIIVLVASPFLHNLSFLSGYVILFVLLFVSRILQQFLGLFARGISKVKIVGISGVVSSFVVVISNILLLFVFHLGVKGYLISIIISHYIAALILFVGGKMWNYLTKSKDKVLNREIIAYSLPMVPNSLSWWINHSANRFILQSYCGVGDVGLYSAASKMPSLIDTFRGIFVQAWQLSTISEYDKKDSNSFFSNIYKAYNVFLILLCSLLIMFSQLIAKVLYAKEFFVAWKITPLLLLGVLFGSLVAYYSPTYLAYRKTGKLFISTFLGATLTILLNFILVPIIGIYGAAVGSSVSYFVVYLYLHIDSRKYNQNHTNNFKYYISYALVAVQAVMVSFCDIRPLGFVAILIFLVLIIINRKDISSLLNMFHYAIKNKIDKKNKKHESEI